MIFKNPLHNLKMKNEYITLIASILCVGYELLYLDHPTSRNSGSIRMMDESFEFTNMIKHRIYMNLSVFKE